MEKSDYLKAGDTIDDTLRIFDEDRLAYEVEFFTRGKWSIRTISKRLLLEFIDYFEATGIDHTARDARIALAGMSKMDKFEYGYESTFTKIAKYVIVNRKQIFR